MFEAVNELAKKLPRPPVTGNAVVDDQAREIYIGNARRMRSEAFACLGRAFVGLFVQGWRGLTVLSSKPAVHQA